MIQVCGKIIRPEHFSDGTFKLDLRKSEIDFSFPNDDYVFVHWHYEDESELSLMWQIANHMKDIGMILCRLNIPYLPNARMDRVRDREHEVFTLKHFCRFINALDFKEVHVFDPHSDVAKALIDRLVVDTPESNIGYVFSRAIDDSYGEKIGLPVIIFPDCGSLHRYRQYIRPSYYTGYGIKKRNWNTGVIESLTIVSDEDLSDRNVVIVDDICSSGGTILETAKAVKELGAKKIFVYVSHLDPKVGAKALNDSPIIDEIYTTNSLTVTSTEIFSLRKITVL